MSEKFIAQNKTTTHMLEWDRKAQIRGRRKSDEPGGRSDAYGWTRLRGAQADRPRRRADRIADCGA
ncbi:hypothetical protein [Streptomyces californicus]|uniref:hypothetical protein n=1 Tax=Streptomyces californicus TaxID=67351 RepID=UPI0036C9CF0C